MNGYTILNNGWRVCGRKTNELYLTDIGEILCVDCEAEYCHQQTLDEQD